jgi:dihydrofolate synthase/folylpolyglutamate synthase
MDYPQVLAYLESFIDHEKNTSYNYNSSFKLERMMRFAALLGDPQKGIKSIHVAGTKGKGSTAAFIHSILGKAGYRTGLYTSPHLLSFRERIRIGDSLISEDDMARMIEGMRPTIDLLKGEQRPSFFEVYTALAYKYFREKNVDFAVYEVGLGGRLDATNIIEPLVSVITPVSYEHMDKLGSTLSQIASEKAGIVKHGIPCVSAPQEKEALGTIEKICQERSSPLAVVGRDINFKEIGADDTGETFNVTGIGGRRYAGLKTSLIGSHQVVNAATAIGAIEILETSGIKIAQDAVRDGVAGARWDGRLQVVERKPLVVLDGAQNRASAAVVRNSVKKIFKFRKLALILGISKDKDIPGILEELLPIADSVILTKSSVKERAAEPAFIMGLMGPRSAVSTSSVEEALKVARSNVSPEDMILVAGSLFVVGDALKLLSKT